jgi:amidohydrolase
LQVVVHGAGGHGGRPHLARDPVPVIAEIVTALQTVVTRQFDVFDPVVISVGVVEAGTAHNVISGSARLEATMRSFSTTARARLAEATTRAARGIADAHGLRAEAWVEPMYPVTVNDPAEAARCLRVAADLFGADRVEELEHPRPGAEDFSLVLEAVPGAMAFLGVCVPERDPATAPYNHSAHALHDDALLSDGALLLATLALEHLEST